MFRIIKEEKYKIIKEFCNQYKQKVSVNSVLDGTSPGRVFADDENNPTLVLVWVKPVSGNLFGRTDNIDQLNKTLNRLLDEVIIPESLELDNQGFFITLYDEVYWNSYKDKILPNRSLIEADRWIPVFDQKNFRKSKELLKPLPAGYELKMVSKEMLLLEQNQAAKASVLYYWNNIEKFINIGFGFCITKDKKIISSCIADFKSEMNYQIDIETFDVEERKKGFASHCAIAFNDHCLQNNYLPSWEADFENFASQELALKVGFVNPKMEKAYVFYFNKANNFILQIHYRLSQKESKIDQNFILSNVKNALEVKSDKLSTNYIFHAAKMLAKHGIKDYVFLLLGRYLEEKNNAIKQIKENSVFEFLHETDEWKEMLNKYD